MSATETSSGWKTNLVERLHHPMQLRVFITVAVFIVGYCGVYVPLDGTIADTTQKLGREERRLALARDVEHLRAQQKQFQDRLPKQRDPNEWVEYLLGSVRSLPLKLVTLEAKSAIDVGPYKAVVMECEMEGAFHDMESLLRWIEYNDRLFRIDTLRISPHRSNNGTLVLHLIVLGVMN
jgi:Tfp pilus assembly protein PilO